MNLRKLITRNITYTIVTVKYKDEFWNDEYLVYGTTSVKAELKKLLRSETHPTDEIPVPAENTLYPAGIEKRPLRFAIEYRNLWMIEQADYAIVYMNHHISKTAQLVQKAKRRGLKVINIAEK